MLDFLIINTTVIKKRDKQWLEISPTFKVRRSKDLMIRGGDFYAIWDEERGFWSTSQDDVVDLIDRELLAAKKKKQETFDGDISVKWMWDSNSGSIDKWHKYVQKQMVDNYNPLDEKILFGDSIVKKEDYATRKLDYALAPGDISAYDELMQVLYAPEERKKIEWAIGAIASGKSKDIQKFMVFYGGPGTGKSTVLNIIEKLFHGYCSSFDAKSLGSSNDSFALEAFKNNPIVAIQHDGDLSRIEDNSRINSLVSHETLVINEKFRSMYTMRFNTFLIMGTNKPVKITDAKSGITRRLIDVSPTGDKIPMKKYNDLIKKISFEYGAITYHCLKVFEEDPDIYNNYIPLNMIGATNDFYNFMEDMYETYVIEDQVSLKSAWESYKIYCDDAKVLYPLSKRAVKEELKNYFNTYESHNRFGSNMYTGFKTEKFIMTPDDKKDIPLVVNGSWLKFEKRKSLLDDTLKDMPAQYANDEGFPKYKWANCKKTLKDIDTRKLHYVKVPQNLIVIDFDIPGDDGEKSFEKNLEAASVWPKTYAELSKSGKGIHLHYIYAGDVTKLSNKYNDKVEIKVFQGDASLRRMVTRCNDIPIATISSGLPLKGGERKMLDWEGVKNEQMLRNMISKCLRKEYHGFTTPEVNYICYLFDEAYNSGMKYDLSDMKDSVIKFAGSSTHHKSECLTKVADIHYKSDDALEPIPYPKESDMVFFDVESFPEDKEKNLEALLVVCYKKAGTPLEKKYVTKMINPTPTEIEHLLKYKLVGFNNRDYDNHILYSRLIGKTPAQINDISQKIIKGFQDAKYAPAYGLSYTDVYDFSTKKQSLKRWEIDLNANHQENHYPWDEAVSPEHWDEIADYCANDVIATEMVFNACATDWEARQILADLSGGTVNDTTNRLTLKMIFGEEKNPQLVYTDLSTGISSDGTYNEFNRFEGYEFSEYGIDTARYSAPPSPKHKSIYLGMDPSEGGYVEAKIGYAEHVGLLDIASMHPSSIIALNLFGKYTKNYKALLDARIAIKHKDIDTLKTLFNGKLEKYLENDEQMESLSKALKLPINSIYGLTSAGFQNPARDPRNIDNIVAKRGALFMLTLRREFEKKSWKIIHFKTDSIKIPNMTTEQKNFVIEFGRKYGYEFEHEATYEKFCLVNESTYIAKYDEFGERTKGGKHAGCWTATGTQFQVPYVFKSLFSKEDIKFEDMCETKTTKSALYLDMNEGLPDVTEFEKVKKLRSMDLSKLTKSNAELLERYSSKSDEELDEMIATGHDYRFIGRVGLFTPICTGCGGGLLLREADTDKYSAVTGTKGFRWLESSSVKGTYLENFIDKSYYQQLCDDAKSEIGKHCDFEKFASDEKLPPMMDITSDELPF